MSKPLHEILPTVFNTTHTWKFQLLRQWHEILGKLSHVVHLEKIEQTTLVLGVNDSCWLQELYLLSPLILTTINKKLENAPIKQLRFKLASIKKSKSYEPRLAVLPQIEDRTLHSTEQQALQRIKDPELQRVLKQFLIRCYTEK
jgi:Dna[CI] antecedent DciA-like protein